MQSKPKVSLNNGQRTVRGRFATGNAYGKGRPLGARNKRSIMLDHLLEGEAMHITRKLVDTALDGNIDCMKICIDLILPNCKERPIKLNLNELKTGSDVVEVMKNIVNEICCGRMPINDGKRLFDVLDNYMKSFIIPDLERQIKELTKHIDQFHFR